MMEQRTMLSGNGLLADINIPLEGFEVVEMVALDDQIYFSGRSDEAGLGNELWRYDPAAHDGQGGVFLVRDILAGEASSHPHALTVFQGQLYFSAATNPGKRTLWQYDPIIDELREFEIPPTEDPSRDKIYFQAIGDTGYALFVYDPNDESDPYGTLEIQETREWTFEDMTKAYEIDFAELLGPHGTRSTVDGHIVMVASSSAGRDDPVSLDPLSVTIDEDRADPWLGQLFILDPDFSNERRFAPQTQLSGQYGEFTIDADGNCSYSLRTEDTQFLAAGETVTDEFTVTDANGTSSETFSIVITGSNDAPTPIITQSLVPQRIDAERTFSLIESDPDTAPSEVIVRWEVYYKDGAEPIVTQLLDATAEFRFTPRNFGDYEVRAVAIDQDDAEGVSSVTISVGVPTRVTMTFPRPPITFPGDLQFPALSIGGNPPRRLYHEWEDVKVELWLDASIELFQVSKASFKWEIFVDNPLFGQVQTVWQNGEQSSWEMIPQDGGWLIRGEVQGFETSDFQVLSRRRLATIVLPRNMEHMPGLPVEESGHYAQGRLLEGIEFRSAYFVLGDEYALDMVAGNDAVVIPVVYDADDDGRVDLKDFSGFVQNFGKSVGENAPEAYRYDYNRNGKVDLADFSYFVQHFGFRKDLGISHLDIPFLTTEDPDLAESEPVDRAPLGITDPKTRAYFDPPPANLQHPQLVIYLTDDSLNDPPRYKWREDPSFQVDPEEDPPVEDPTLRELPPFPCYLQRIGDLEPPPCDTRWDEDYDSHLNTIDEYYRLFDLELEADTSHRG